MLYLNNLVVGALLGLMAWLGDVPRGLAAAEEPATLKYGGGTFVSFRDGNLTIKENGDFVEFKQDGERYKTYQNNEDGPGAKLVDTVEILSRAVPAYRPTAIESLATLKEGSVVTIRKVGEVILEIQLGIAKLQ